jgi:hypothetical protein
VSGDTSPRFKEAARSALLRAMDPARTPDDAIRYMARHIPIYLEYEASPQQAAEAGCAQCPYLGMWTPDWPGYERSPHGTIVLFEKHMQHMHGNLEDNAYEVLTHEMGHALQRDHVLDALERDRVAAYARGLTLDEYWTQAPRTRGCGCPGQSR